MIIDTKNCDCFEFLKEIPDNSVELILIDPPYGTINGIKDSRGKYNRNTEWDVTLDTSLMFSECNRVLKRNGVLIVFAQEPYTSHIITSAHSNLPFLYRGIWKKNNTGNALSAKKALLNYFEDIVIFAKRPYDYELNNPLRQYAKDVQKYTGKNGNQIKKEMNNSTLSHFFTTGFQFCVPMESVYEKMVKEYQLDKMPNFIKYAKMKEIDKGYSTNKKTFNLGGKSSISNVFEYPRPSGIEKCGHPTQKPVALLKDLIAIFSNAGDTVVDFTMGSGSTGVAAIELNRSFMGCELDPDFYTVAATRIIKANNERVK